MKRKTIVLVIVLISSLSLNAQPWQWYEQNSGVTTQLNCVSGIYSTYYYIWNAWISGVNGVVLRTSNLGTNWLNVSGGGISNTVNLTTICGIDSVKALTTGTIGGTAYVYRTTNAGANWSVVFTQTGGYINVIQMTSSTGAIMIGNPVGGRWSIWKTTNQGAAWDSTGLRLPQSGGETGFSNSFCLTGDNRMWFGTNNFRIYYSTNGGINWVVQSTAPQKNSACIFFEYQYYMGYGYMGGDSLMFTTNYGTNWRYCPSMGSGRFGGIHGTSLIGAQDSIFAKTYYIRSDNKVYYKLYGQMSQWQVRYTAPSGTYTHFCRIFPSSTSSFDAFAVRDNGGITKGWIEMEGAVKKISSQTPAEFKLMQNYPNPFNPVTTMRFDIPAPLSSATGGIGEGPGVRLTIYNTLGSEIATLVNEPLAPGIYEVSWDASAYPSGVYFYKLIAGDPSTSPGQSFVQTRKMVLLK